MNVKYLIIGNSVAGVFGIEGIRSRDREGTITVVSDEPIVNYSRPLISYFLGGKVGGEQMPFRNEAFYTENKVNLLVGKKASSLDPKRKEVKFADGKKIKYEKLLVATGGIPIVPPIEGLDMEYEGIFTFTKLNDAEEIIKYIEKNQINSAIVLGAGLIGLKCTEGLVERGIGVTIIELADKILANTFDKDASSILEKSLAKWGCKVIKENTIAKVITENKKVHKVMLKDGTELNTSLLVIAIGVRPNLTLVEGTKIRVNRGILVDEFMETNIKDIYAAGDVTEGLNLLTSQNTVLAIWPVAARQGKVGGMNMATVKRKDRVKYRGSFIMNSVELAGVPTISFGITNPPEEEGYEILVRKDEGNKIYRKIVLKEDRIVGAIFLGKIERAGIFSGLIKDQLDVSEFKHDLLSDDFGLLVLPKEYRKHMVVGEGIEV